MQKEEISYKEKRLSYCQISQNLTSQGNKGANFSRNQGKYQLRVVCLAKLSSNIKVKEKNSLNMAKLR